MLFARGRWLIAAATIGLTVASAGQTALAQAPATSPSPAPSTTAPVSAAGAPGATPAATPAPAAATASAAQPAPAGSGTEITRESDGQTVHVPQGSTVTVRMGTDLDWTVSFDPPGVLQAVPGVGTLARGVQALVRAVQPGSTTLTAEGKPHCNPGQACAQFIVSVIVTIIVDPAGGTAQQPVPPAGSTPTGAAPAPSATAAPGVGLPNTGTGGALAGKGFAAALAALAAVPLLLIAALWRRGDGGAC